MLLPCMDLSELYEESLTLQKHVIHFTKLWMFFETTPNQEQQSQKSAALWTLMPNQGLLLSCINPLACLALYESFTQLASSDHIHMGHLESTRAQNLMLS